MPRLVEEAKADALKSVDGCFDLFFCHEEIRGLLVCTLLDRRHQQLGIFEFSEFLCWFTRYTTRLHTVGVIAIAYGWVAIWRKSDDMRFL